MSRLIATRPIIDVNSTPQAEIALVYFQGNPKHWSEFILVDIDRSISGTLLLVFECRFRSPAPGKHRITFCDITLALDTPNKPNPLFIAIPPAIEAPPREEIEVTKTKSLRVTGGVGISYFASLRAHFSRSSTERYSVIERETQDVVRRGRNTLELIFNENRKLKNGLNGERRVSIRVENIEGLSCIRGTFDASFRYTAAHPLGFVKSYLENVTTTFTIAL